MAEKTVQKTAYRYQVGGSLRATSPTYIYREADDRLYDHLKSGEFCYVFNCRQMGKSSLRNQTMRRLISEKFCCISVDLTTIGSRDISNMKWYRELLNTIHQSPILQPFTLVDFDDWWTTYQDLPPISILRRYFKEVLLRQLPSEKIVIFIDEIDVVLSLDFDASDFFALIRACFNLRSEDPDYERLTFAFFGVTTPASLIQDLTKTPFNIGRDIPLSGLELDRSHILAEGLIGYVPDPKAVLEEILNWTGGQPFLTQKLCHLVQMDNLDLPQLNEGEEANWVEQLVRSQVIENWESHDNPVHLRTIRDRIFQNEQQSGRLLGLYQKILRKSEISFENTPEERDLQLSGLVVKTRKKLKIYNPIYTEVFNQEWLDYQFSKLRPYSETLNVWVDSLYQDTSQLLRGQELESAKKWAYEKNLSDLDHRYLSASREFSIQEKNQEKLRQRIKQLRTISTIAIIAAIVALVFGWQALSQKEIAETTEVKALHLTTQALLNSETSRETLETLVSSVKTGKGFLRTKLRLSDTKNAVLKEEIENDLKYSLYNVMERNRFSHTNTVLSVSFSPDLNPNDQLIASAGADGEAKIWNLNGKTYRTLKHQSDVNDVTFSPDGQLIATASQDRTLKLWSRDGQLLKVFKKGNHSFRKIAFSPDSQSIAVATESHQIIVWQVETSQIKVILEGDNGDQKDNLKHSFWDVEFSPDGQSIAASSTDKTVKVWDVQTGKIINLLEGHRDWVYSVSFSPNGDLIASSGGGSDKSLKIWQRKSGKLLKTIEKAHNNGFRLKFSPNGKLIATAGNDQIVKFWNVNSILSTPEVNLTVFNHSDILLKTIRGHKSELNDLSFSQDSRLITFAGVNKTVTVWEIDPFLERNINASEFVIKKVVMSPDGQTIATGGGDNTIRLWDREGKLLKTLSGHSEWIFGLSFSSDGQWIASASEDTTVKIWNTKTGKLHRQMKHDNKAYDVSFSPNGQILASIGNDNKLRLWNAQSGQPLQTFDVDSNLFHAWGTAFSPEGQLIAATTREGIKLWRVGDRRHVQTLKGQGNTAEILFKFSFNSSGQILAAGNMKNVNVWNVKDGKLITTLQGHKNMVLDVKFSADNSLIATASADRTIKIWTSDGKLLRTLEGSESPIHGIAFSPDNQRLISVDEGGDMKFWNLNYLDRDILDLEQLIQQGCDRLQDYLENNPKIKEDDRNICT